MLALGLFMMLAGSIMGMLPGMLIYTVNAEVQYRFVDDGIWIFEIGGFFTLFILIRWVYRIVFGPVKDKCKKLDELEEQKQDKMD